MTAAERAAEVIDPEVTDGLRDVLPRRDLDGDAIPDDAISTGIWAKVPCKRSLPSGVAPCELDNPTGKARCQDCNGDGTRVVVTDVEVELTITSESDFHIDFEDDFQNAPAGKYWREVQP